MEEPWWPTFSTSAETSYPASKNLLLAVGFRVPGEEEGGLAVHQADDGGVVVHLLPHVLLLGGHHLEFRPGGAVDHRAGAQLGDHQVLLQHPVQQRLVGGGGGGLVLGDQGHVDAADVKALDDPGHAAHVVCVGVGADQGVDALHPQVPQVVGEAVGVLVLSRVQQDVEVVPLGGDADELAVPLAHVQKVDLQAVLQGGVPFGQGHRGHGVRGLGGLLRAQPVVGDDAHRQEEYEPQASQAGVFGSSPAGPSALGMWFSHAFLSAAEVSPPFRPSFAAAGPFRRGEGAVLPPSLWIFPIIPHPPENCNRQGEGCFPRQVSGGRGGISGESGGLWQTAGAFV